MVLYLSIANFIYDDISFNTFEGGKYVIAGFNTETTASEGTRNLNQISLFMGKERPFGYLTYDTTLTFTISIIKNPCMDDNIIMGTSEIERLKRWLCRPAPHKLKLVSGESTNKNWDDYFNQFNQYENIYWEGSFNVTEELIGGRRIGVSLTFISTRPFALQEDTVFSGIIEAGQSIIIKDASNEIGYLYPDMTIKCLEGGELSIHNDFEDRYTVVENCTANETITFSRYLQITSDSASHNVYDNFNYVFLRIGNNFYSNENVLTFSMGCEYEIRYNPIRKVLPV